MNSHHIQYQFLISAFQASPDRFLERFRKRLSCSDFFEQYFDVVVELAHEDVNNGYLRESNVQVVDVWKKKAAANCETFDVQNKNRGKSLFESLKCACQDCLVIQDGEPFFRIEQIKLWQALSFALGEDLFVSSMLANQDVKMSCEPINFQWPYILRSNYWALNHLLERRKLNENHYHLWGSSPNVDLSWIYLMNHPFGQQKKYETLFGEKLSYLQRAMSYDTYQQKPLSLWVQIAAYLRVVLYEMCCRASFQNGKDLLFHLRKISQIVEAELFAVMDFDLVGSIQGYRMLSSGQNIDYAIPSFLCDRSKPNWSISGERFFCYSCLKYIYSNKPNSKEIEILYYLYLLIRNRFSDVFIQKNSKYGFTNFQEYQDRKLCFIKGTDYLKLAAEMAVSENINDNALETLELRISPKNTVVELKKTILGIDGFQKNGVSQVESFLKKQAEEKVWQGNKKYFYVIHFTKPSEKEWNEKKDMYLCREEEERKKIEKQAKVIRDLRRECGDAAYRIYGIDAASTEVNFRPENYGQAFRYLSGEKQVNRSAHYDKNRKYLPDLRKTYHVGEDFYDIVDGLRAIDEAVLYLELKYGDRIGHGVALGLDVESYYQKRPVIALPRQNKLDNLAWMIWKIQEFGIKVPPAYLDRLRYQFDDCYCEMHHHIEKLVSPDLNHYIESWKLRGDNPACFSNLNVDAAIKNKYLNPIGEWDNYALRDKKKYREILEHHTPDRPNAIFDLVYRYHYDNQLKKMGLEPVEVEITKEDVEIVKQLQLKMRNFVLRSGVAVESCPSSNFLISNLKDFKEIPTYRIFPICEQKNDFVRLNVSVNTDDQGVFYTSLAKEYALLAGTLQQELDDDGMRVYSDDTILNWIDHLISNGKEQCFLPHVGGDCCPRDKCSI